MKYYAGIGSRQTPIEILNIMTKLAVVLESEGWTLRSGGADGADNAFAKEVKNIELFLPWKGFNGHTSDLNGHTQKAYEIAKKAHPAWHRCSQGAQKLHSRNVHQVFGWDINPKTYSKYIICWTPNAKMVGGTATAMKLAKNAGIKIFNLADKTQLNKILKYLKEKESICTK